MNVQPGRHAVRSGLARPRFIYWWMTWVAPVLIGGFVALAIVLAFRRHATFHTPTLDLGYYTQVIWNTGRGRWFASSLKPPTFLADHFAPLLAVLAPLFWLVPNARTLLVIQAAALAVSVFPGYAILKARYPVLAPLLVLAFVLNPLLHQLAAEEFHEIMLAAPVLALALYALHAARNHLFLVALALALLIREDMGIYVASFGVHLLVCRPGKRWQGLFLLGIGMAWVLVITGLVIPAFGAGSYRHAHLFPGSTHSIPTNVLTLLRDPLSLLNGLPTRESGTVLLRVFLPLAGIPLLASGHQLLWAPYLLLMLVSSRLEVRTLADHYPAPFVGLFWSSIAVTIARMKPGLARLSIGLVLSATVIGFRAWSPFPGGSLYEGAMYRMTEHAHIGHTVLARIPPRVSVAAQDKLGAHLATRERVHLFPWFESEVPPDMVVIDTKDPNPYLLTPSELHSSLLQLQLSPEVQTVWEQDGYFLFKIASVPRFPRQGPWMWEPWLRLEGYDIAQTDDAGAFSVVAPTAIAPDRTVRVALYWTALAPMEVNYSISVRLVAPDGRIVAQHDSWPGQGLCATRAWAVGRTIRDTHYFRVAPGMLTGPLELVVLVYDTDTMQPILPAGGRTLTKLAAGN